MLILSLSSAFVAISLSFGASALTRDLNIANAQLSPDGFARAGVLVDGSFPGPLLTETKGGNFQLNIVNQLTDNTMLRSTAIHWHGFFQSGTNWADGPAFVSQCPIAANNSFVYDFTAVGQSGTFWYHSHLQAQYCDGLRGAMVVYDPEDPHLSLYDVDDASTVITLADWYHTVSPAAGNFPTPDSTLINGLGRYSGGPASPLAVINVESGKRYRFRLVSLSCDPNWVFSIDGHTSLTIIEVDTENTVGLVVDEIQIFAGQRYSFVMTANQPVDNYWIRANPNIGTAGFDGGLNSAILRYAGAPVADPVTTQATAASPLVESNLHPLTSAAAPGRPEVGGVDLAINLNLGFAFPSFTINGAHYESPSVPVLLQIMSGAQEAADLLPAGSLITLPVNSVIELSIPAGLAGGPHPFHLHGHVFSVVRSAGSSTYNYVDPVKRDVVSIGGAGDNVTIRWVTDNPGPWFLHCHIDWHLERGLALVFAEATANTTRSTMNVPAAWDQLCPIYDALTPDQL